MAVKKKSDPRTTMFGLIAAIGLAVSNTESPIAQYIPENVRVGGAVAGTIAVMLLGRAAADKKKPNPEEPEEPDIRTHSDRQ